MSYRRAVTTALWPALAVAAAGLALAPPAQANLALTVSASGGVIAACNATDGGTGTLSKNCANPKFSQIIVTAVGAPLIPAPGLFATQISLTSGNATSADTLTIDVAQSGLSFAAGTVNLTVGGMGPSPVTLTALGPGRRCAAQSNLALSAGRIQLDGDRIAHIGGQTGIGCGERRPVA